MQLGKPDRNATGFLRSYQGAQYTRCGYVDGGHDREIDDHGPDPAGSIVHHADDPAADMLRIEVEPGTRAAHNQGTRSFAGLGISGATDEAPGGLLIPKDGNDRSRCQRDQHDKRTGCSEQEAIKQPRDRLKGQPQERSLIAGPASTVFWLS
jgi:hypothetical protein